MSLIRKDLPAALLVDQAQIEKAVAALKSFVPAASIIFW
jgi:hypothetical protein